jgi:hypothetical protein
LQHCKIVEGAKDAICHFYSGLRRDIQDILDYKDFDTIDKLFQFAMLVEKEVQGRQQSQHRPRSTFGATPTPKTTPRTSLAYRSHSMFKFEFDSNKRGIFIVSQLNASET